jgi:hypothetical protein
MPMTNHDMSDAIQQLTADAGKLDEFTNGPDTGMVELGGVPTKTIRHLVKDYTGLMDTTIYESSQTLAQAVEAAEASAQNAQSSAQLAEEVASHIDFVEDLQTTATPLPYGESPYANYDSSLNILDFGLPLGPQGVQGETGPDGPQGPQGETPPLSDSVDLDDSDTAASSKAVKTVYDEMQTALGDIADALDVINGEGV